MGCILDGGVGGYKSQPNWDVNDSTYDQWIIKFCGSTLFNEVGEENALLEWKIIPNPTFGSFRVTSSSFDQLKEINIYNLSGQNVFHSSVLNSEAEINTDMIPGLYIVKFTTITNKCYFEKLLKF